MIRLNCPICLREQEAPDGKYFVFCKYCGNRINVAEAAAPAAQEPAAPQPAQAPQPEAPQPQQAYPYYAPAELSQQPAEPAAQPETVPAAAQPARAKSQKAKKKGKGGLVAAIIILVLLLGGGAAAYLYILKPANAYKAAEALRESGDYDGAIEAFEALGDYKDAAVKIDECTMGKALEELKTGKYSRAVKTMKGIATEGFDTSAFSKAAQDAVADLVKKGDEQGALEALASFTGMTIKLDDAVKARYTELMNAEEPDAPEKAEAFLATFKDYITDSAFTADVLKTKALSLLEAGKDGEVKALLAEFGERLGGTDFLSEAVQARAVALQAEDKFQEANGLLLEYKDLVPESAFSNETLKNRILSVLGSGDTEYASRLLNENRSLLDDLAFVSDNLGARANELIVQGKFEETKALLNDFVELDLDVSATLLSAFQTMLNNNDTDSIQKLLANLSEYIPDEAPYRTALANRLQALVDAADPEAALALCEAAPSLDPGTGLKQAVETAMKNATASANIEKIAVLYHDYHDAVSGLEDKVRSAAEQLIAASNLDEANVLLQEMALSFDVREQRYNLAVALLDEGRTEDASEVLSDLGDYKDSQKLLAKEALYQELMPYMETLEDSNQLMSLDDLIYLYESMDSLDGYKNSSDLLKEIAAYWVEVLYETDYAWYYADSLIDHIEYDYEMKNYVGRYLLEESPDLVWIEGSTRWWQDPDSIDGVLHLTETLYADCGNLDFEAFARFVKCVDTLLVADLPYVDDIYRLWDYRDDVKTLCRTDETLMLFLCDSWYTSSDAFYFSMEQLDDSNFSLGYPNSTPLNLPSYGTFYLDVSNNSLVIVNSSGTILTYLFDITIVDYDVIEVYNYADKSTHTLYR